MVHNIDEVVREEFIEIGNRRIHHAAFRVRTYTGEFVVLLQQGVLAGDPFAVRGFRDGFMIPANEWESLQQKQDPLVKLTVVWAPVRHKSDAAKGVCADDICRVLLVGRGARKPESLVQKLAFKQMSVFTDARQLVSESRKVYRVTQTSVQQCLNRHDMHINEAKQVCQPLFSCRYSSKAREALQQQGMRTSSHNTVHLASKYLGPVLTDDGGNKQELKKRLQQMQIASTRCKNDECRHQDECPASLVQK